MPCKAKHPCRAPGCATLVENGEFCDDHTSYHIDKGERRPNAHQRGYGANWRRLRAAFLSRNPLCADPFGDHAQQVVPATDVDHIVAKRAGGTNEDGNLQALCHSCHSRKTRGEKKGDRPKKSQQR